MRVLITGAAGQLGRALQRTAPEGAAILPLTRAELDIANRSSIMAAVADYRPDLILNAAAYTAVDAAENNADDAYRINADAPLWLAEAAMDANARLIHVSTDYVFDGQSCTPYSPDAETRPLNVYGQSKRQGELNVMSVKPDALVVRTSWVYGIDGKNFVKTMLRLMNNHGVVRVVDDQIGSPTHAEGLALALWRLDQVGAQGFFHYSDAGVASWYDFAVAIAEEAKQCGLIGEATVLPIPSSSYPTPAVRPQMCVLDKQKTWDAIGVAHHWREQLRRMLATIEKIES